MQRALLRRMKSHALLSKVQCNCKVEHHCHWAENRLRNLPYWQTLSCDGLTPDWECKTEKQVKRDREMQHSTKKGLFP